MKMRFFINLDHLNNVELKYIGKINISLIFILHMH